METQLAKLKAFMAAGDHRAALRLAAGWQRLGPQKARITRAWAALVNPAFYLETGKNPATLINDGIAAIRERYNIPEAAITE